VCVDARTSSTNITCVFEVVEELFVCGGFFWLVIIGHKGLLDSFFGVGGGPFFFHVLDVIVSEDNIVIEPEHGEVQQDVNLGNGIRVDPRSNHKRGDGTPVCEKINQDGEGNDDHRGEDGDQREWGDHVNVPRIGPFGSSVEAHIHGEEDTNCLDPLQCSKERENLIFLFLIIEVDGRCRHLMELSDYGEDPERSYDEVRLGLGLKPIGLTINRADVLLD